MMTIMKAVETPAKTSSTANVQGFSNAVAIEEPIALAYEQRSAVHLDRAQRKLGVELGVDSNPAAVNVSKEGVRDWFCYQSEDLNRVGMTCGRNIHSKLLGGQIQTHLFRYWGNISQFIFSNESDSLWEMSSVMGDDYGLKESNIAQVDAPLRSSRKYTQLKSIGYMPRSDWGFALPVRTRKTRQTLNLYFMFSSGRETIDNQLKIDAHLEDGTADSRLICPLQTDKHFYKLPIVFCGDDADGGLLWVLATVIQNTGDAETQVGFQGATLA